jgi:hypothetical protein
MLALIVSTSAMASKELMQKLNALQERVEELEYSGYKNIAEISGMVKHTSVNVDLIDNGDTLPEGSRNYRRHLISSKIDINARPVPNLFISSRMSMKKLWYNQSYENSDKKTYVDEMVFGESRQGVSPGDSSIYMERAYIQWEFIPSYTFTVGRLPLAGGSPKDIMEGTPSDAPFHKFTMSEINDGAALSKRFTLDNKDEIKLTLAYLPWSIFDSSKQARIANSGYESRLRDSEGKLIENAGDIFILLSDYSSRNLSFTREFKTSFQYALWDDIFIGPSSGNLRTSINRYTLTSDFNGIGGSKFDVSLAYTYSATASTGAFAGGGLFCTQSATEACEVNGNAFMGVVNYRATADWSYGYLYLSNSAHNLLFDNDMDLGYILFMSPGSDNHILYTNYRFNPYLSGAISYTRAKISKTFAVSNLIGNETDVDYTIDGMKFSLSARF